jgi:hypothetical protein
MRDGHCDIPGIDRLMKHFCFLYPVNIGPPEGGPQKLREVPFLKAFDLRKWTRQF